MQFTVLNDDVAEFYVGKTNTAGNSGFDLYFANDTMFPANGTLFVSFGVAAKTQFGSGYWLLPRSSISKTPLRMANSVGLIDPEYRGPLIVAFSNTSDSPYEVKRGTRLAQVAIPSLMPFPIEWVDKLDDTARGSGGFGSTGV
jgi:dUTP pyrophosphatase